MIVRTILLSIEVVICLLLIGLILMQKSKGSGGLGTAFGGGMGESLFGSRAGNVLTRATIVLAAAFMVNTLLLALVMAGGRIDRTIMDRHQPPPRHHPPVTETIPEGDPAPVPPMMEAPGTVEAPPLGPPMEVEEPIPGDVSPVAPPPDGAAPIFHVEPETEDNR